MLHSNQPSTAGAALLYSLAVSSFDNLHDAEKGWICEMGSIVGEVPDKIEGEDKLLGAKDLQMLSPPCSNKPVFACFGEAQLRKAFLHCLAIKRDGYQECQSRMAFYHLERLGAIFLDVPSTDELLFPIGGEECVDAFKAAQLVWRFQKRLAFCVSWVQILVVPLNSSTQYQVINKMLKLLKNRDSTKQSIIVIHARPSNDPKVDKHIANAFRATPLSQTASFKYVAGYQSQLQDVPIYHLLVCLNPVKYATEEQLHRAQAELQGYLLLHSTAVGTTRGFECSLLEQLFLEVEATGSGKLQITRERADALRLVESTQIGGISSGPHGRSPRISVDVLEGVKSTIFLVELPGVRDPKVDVSQRHRILTIAGKKERASGLEGETNWVLHGREVGEFFWESSPLQRDLDLKSITLTLKDGVLLVEIPKKAGN